MTWCSVKIKHRDNFTFTFKERLYYPDMQPTKLHTHTHTHTHTKLYDFTHSLYGSPIAADTEIMQNSSEIWTHNHADDSVKKTWRLAGTS
jgi:hypothetical protein